MKNQKVINFLTNKFILILMPYFIIVSRFLNYYVQSEKYDYIVTFSSLKLFLIVNFVIFVIEGLIINKISKNVYINYIIMFIFSLLFFLIPNIYIFVVMLFLIFIISFVFRNNKIPLKEVTCFLVIFNFFLFLFSFLPATVKKIDLLVNLNRKNIKYEIKVDKNIEKTPNIYYIHCDGMMSMEAMSKLFNYRDDELRSYLKDNDFSINSDAILPLGHRTQKVLVALFNPYYYDNKGKMFIDDLENYYDSGIKVKNYISYEEMQDKRMNNELLIALKKKGYTTYGIGSFNQYTSMYTDYYYDFNYFYSHRNNLSNFELKLIDKSVSKNFLNSYINYQILADMYPNKAFFKTENFNIYKNKFKNVNLDTPDLGGYNYINNTTSKKVQAITKGLYDIFNEKNKNKFVFVDYDLAHLMYRYDKNGNLLSNNVDFKKGYSENYIYVTHVLIDLLKYINENDKNSIIIIQADHGIHVLSCDELVNNLKISKNQCMYVMNSTISSFYIPAELKNGDEKYLRNPLNFSRYIVNNYVGKKYEYVK